MKNAFTATVAITISATPQRVWQALTTPETIAQYFFGSTVTSTWQVGDSIQFTGEWEGKAYIDKGTILKNNEPNELQFDYFSSWSNKPDIPENYNIITYHIIRQGDETCLTVTQTNCDSGEQAAHSEQNWIAVLNGLKKILE